MGASSSSSARHCRRRRLLLVFGCCGRARSRARRRGLPFRILPLVLPLRSPPTGLFLRKSSRPPPLPRPRPPHPGWRRIRFPRRLPSRRRRHIPPPLVPRRRRPYPTAFSVSQTAVFCITYSKQYTRRVRAEEHAGGACLSGLVHGASVTTESAAGLRRGQRPQRAHPCGVSRSRLMNSDKGVVYLMHIEP